MRLPPASASADLSQAALELHNYSGLLLTLITVIIMGDIRDGNYDDDGDVGDDDGDGGGGDADDDSDGEDDDDGGDGVMMMMTTVRKFSLHKAQGASPPQGATLMLQEL